MTAKEALKLAVKAKLAGENYQTQYIMRRIESAAKNGDTFIVLNYPDIKLYEDDYKYFESLGYKVERDRKEIYRPIDYKSEHESYYKYYYGNISW